MILGRFHPWTERRRQSDTRQSHQRAMIAYLIAIILVLTLANLAKIAAKAIITNHSPVAISTAAPFGAAVCFF